MLACLFRRQGQDGKKCVLRAICEVAEAPMEDGVLGDVVNLLLRSVRERRLTKSRLSSSLISRLSIDDKSNDTGVY